MLKGKEVIIVPKKKRIQFPELTRVASFESKVKLMSLNTVPASFLCNQRERRKDGPRYELVSEALIHKQLG